MDSSMASPKNSASWQDIRRILASKNKNELLNLIRDLYALNLENKNLVYARILAPKPTQRRKASTKATQKSKALRIAPKINRLVNIAEELQQGNSFNITRLVMLKSLCEDPKDAAHFAFHIAKLTHRKMQRKTCPSYLEPKKWEYCKQVADEALPQMKSYIEESTEEKKDLLRIRLSDARAFQNQYEKHRWGPVRIIESEEMLIIEKALSCLLQPTASADWGYRIARRYAERYDPSYGTGLIPESAPMVNDIADFWCQYHLGKSLREWLSTT
jgi:hypothetical protein